MMADAIHKGVKRNATEVRAAESSERVVLTVAPSLAPFLTVGLVAIVAGGLIAAVSRPAGWERGPWVAAFLVLVVGVAQSGLALGQATFGPAPTRRVMVLELLSINVGSACVVAGTLLSSPLVVTAGSLSFAAALASFTKGAIGAEPSSSPEWSRRVFIALLLLLSASVPIGIALTWLRN